MGGAAAEEGGADGLAARCKARSARALVGLVAYPAHVSPRVALLSRRTQLTPAARAFVDTAKAYAGDKCGHSTRLVARSAAATNAKSRVAQ